MSTTGATSRLLRVDPADATPLWNQLEQGLRRLVATGRLPPGSLLPSVRDLAREVNVNPATVAKAYQRLTDAGVLEARRGDGTYVAVSPPSFRAGERARLLREAAARFTSVAVTLGASQEQALRELEAAWPTSRRAASGVQR